MLKVRELREKAGLSQDRLAKAAGVSTSAIYRIEGRGTASVATLCKIAAALGVQPGELFVVQEPISA